MNDRMNLEPRQRCAAGTGSTGLQCARQTSVALVKRSAYGERRAFPLCPQHRIPGKALGYYSDSSLPVEVAS
jgi:hypothetical protein